LGYSNAIFRLDYENGSDATRPTLTGVVFSNNGSGGVRGNYVGHELREAHIRGVRDVQRACAWSSPPGDGAGGGGVAVEWDKGAR